MGEIENIIPDYTHQTQTVVAAGRPQRPLVAAASGAAPVALPAARLAEDGLSASSSSAAGSAASSAPELAKSAPALAQPPAVAQISSRMDTLSVDTPSLSGYNPLYAGALDTQHALAGSRRQYGAQSGQPAAGSQLGGRYSLAPAVYSTTSAMADLGLSAATAIASASSAPPKTQRPAAKRAPAAGSSPSGQHKPRPASSSQQQQQPPHNQANGNNLFSDTQVASQISLISQRPRQVAAAVGQANTSARQQLLYQPQHGQEKLNYDLFRQQQAAAATNYANQAYHSAGPLSSAVH